MGVVQWRIACQQPSYSLDSFGFGPICIRPSISNAILIDMLSDKEYHGERSEWLAMT